MVPSYFQNSSLNSKEEARAWKGESTNWSDRTYIIGEYDKKFGLQNIYREFVALEILFQRKMETFSWSPLSSLACMFSFTIICLSSMILTLEAQGKADPNQVRALDTIFNKLEITDKWNKNTGPCGYNTTYSSGWGSPRIECNCPHKNGTCNITGILIRYMGISGKIPEELQKLPQLTNLDLSGNNLRGRLPSFIGNFLKLGTLDLSSNSLYGVIPEELGKLQNLSFLDLSNNKLYGTIPNELGKLQNLTYLYLYSNSLSGAIPKELGNLQNLNILYLHSNSLSGAIPKELGKLQHVSYLDLSNNKLSDTIPNELGNLRNVSYLDLSSNSLSGVIPNELGNLKNLKQLYLRRNSLNGSIPKELGNLQNLEQLYLSFNSLNGSIPKELGNLQNLKELYLSRNSLSGTIPKELGNLQNINELNLRNNSLSGIIPEELGNLGNLTDLHLSINSFEGSLPSSFGKLKNMKTLYIDSAGLRGEIPLSFAKLTQMTDLRPSDNNFTGKLPDFIATWTNITTLWLQGNAFQGPIPSNFSRLTLLEDLRIGELSNASSSLEFIKNMTSLETLILRNCMITDSLKTLFSETFSNLKHLDLSFNNISGYNVEFPISLISLQYLFLGNNNLSGVLPPNNLHTLNVIDLSYNFFNGRLPSWATDNDADVQLNLVANNFKENDLNSSTKYANLYCLQRDFPCNRSSPKHEGFAVNSGGPSLTNEKMEFEKDENNLNGASFYVTNSKKWAVSSIGVYPSSYLSDLGVYSSGTDLESTIKSNKNTCDSKDSNASDCLLEDVRVSAGSIRYYGLGLHNGNYTVNLKFSIVDSENKITLRNLQSRIFDIYIQGELKKKNFNIKNNATTENYQNIQVKDNFLEIHLFWSGKGMKDFYGPSIAAVSAMLESKRRNFGLIIGISLSCGLIILLAIWIALILRRKKSLNNDEDLRGISFRTQTFSYAELKRATENFASKNKLGEGGFGPVYKGVLSDGRAIAVKQLSLRSHQGKAQFVTEIDVISAVQHRNLVKLYGCCTEGLNRLLVYEYLENKSLDQALFGKDDLDLSWKTRFEICVETGRGLAYLHEESRPKIVHRDVKSSNILLDAELKPKLSDFGLAKLCDDRITHISTKVAGTIGYLAPEYAMKGHLSEKADVFGFGVVLLEILSGRPNFDSNLSPEKVYLLEWAWLLYENSRQLELIDRKLQFFKKEEANRVFTVALLCTQLSPILRPCMSRVVSMLLGDVELSAISSKPGYLNDVIMVDLEGSPTILPSATSITLSIDNLQTRQCSGNTSEALSRFHDY